MLLYLNKKIVAITLGAMTIFPHCYAQSESEETKNPFFNNPEAVRKGEELFGRNCQQCHNSRGKGGKGPQLIRGAWAPGGANSDLYMYATIAGGRPGTQMGGFGTSLEAEDIWQIVSFLRMEAQRVKVADSKAKHDDDDAW
jgi:mono/diheme cytochrome c family protein